jgi:4'-phosphopantetheinyl transferase
MEYVYHKIQLNNPGGHHVSEVNGVNIVPDCHSPRWHRPTNSANAGTRPCNCKNRECRMTAGYPSELSGRDIHVWALRIRPSSDLAAQFEPVLAPDEVERAARFRMDHLRQFFTIARGTLRCLLARYLSVAPARIKFDYGSRGKPALASPTGIEFNLTHSGDLALLALTIGCPVGVDVEFVRPRTEIVDIARRFFSSEETCDIMSLPEIERERAFFSCWTRKEAYIKAIGYGLYAPLDGFRVSVRPGEPARLIHVVNEPYAPDEWCMHDLQLSPEYAAALAYRDRERTVFALPILDASETYFS